MACASHNILYSRHIANSVHRLRTCQFSQRVLVHKSSLLSTSNHSLNTSGIACRSLHLFTKHLKKLQKECTFLLRQYSDVPLTSMKHPDMKRGSFAVLSNEDIAFFKKLLPGRVITDESELLPYNTDWLKTVRGASKVVLRPKTTQEVSEIVKYCYDHNLAVCPQGGNTGLVGGSVPVFDEVVITTQLMNQIISLDQVSGILVCQSGCILEALDHYLSNYELTMPLDLGAKGSCQIGGNVSTNAGGIRLLRYGSLHGNVLGLEVVLPTGEIVDCLTTLRKDNTGYDLKQLFIGAEGTLGIITAVSVLCPPRPKSVSVALLGCETFDAVLQVFKSSKLYLGEILSAFEFMDSQSMILVKENLKLTSPLVDYPFYALVECSGSNAHHDEEKLMSLLHAVLDKGEALDGCIVTDSAKIKNIWSLRERCAEALMYDGYCYKYDVSLPLSAFYQLVLDMRDRLGANATRVVAYGHVGDGNLHLNITSRQYSQTTFDLIEPFVFEWVAKYRGSVSAEHGLGLKKREYIHHSKTPSAVALMAAVKKTIDPKGIMNPYKVLPESVLI